MKIISLWIFVGLFSYGSLALVSYLDNGYQEELLSAEVLQEAVLQAKAENSLAKREEHHKSYLVTAKAEHINGFEDN